MKKNFATWCLVFAFVLPIGYRTASWLVPTQAAYTDQMASVGKDLFLHEWTPDDPLAGGGDGLGPVFNANSCVACHQQAGPGGGGPLEFNVTTFTVRPSKSSEEPRQGVVHVMANSQKFQETLFNVHSALPRTSQPELSDLIPTIICNVPTVRFPSGVHISQRNTPALYGADLIDAVPDRIIIANARKQRIKWGLASSAVEHLPVGRALRLSDGRVGKFGWKAQTPSLLEFVQAACANELGLGNPGQRQPTPLAKTDYRPPALDLTTEQCEQITAYIASLSRPVQSVPENASASGVEAGKEVFHSIGCADCHTPNLGDIEGIYSDLLLHRMGQLLQGGGKYDDAPLEVPEFASGEGPHSSEWRTPPLWGVADSPPYLHDGRAGTLQEAIELHGGQGSPSAQRFRQLDQWEQQKLIAFLKTLRAPKVDKQDAAGEQQSLASR